MGILKKEIAREPTVEELNQLMIWCNEHDQYATFLLCPGCEKYPCPQIDNYDKHVLDTCPLFTRYLVGLSAPRRKKLSYIVKYLDGSYEELEDLDPNNPDLEAIRQVAEVYPINKVLIPTVVLKPKTKIERNEIVKENTTEKKEKEDTPDKPELKKKTNSQAKKTTRKSKKKS